MRQWFQKRRFTGKALQDNLFDRAMLAWIGFLCQPLQGQLVELSPALKGSVADEEFPLTYPTIRSSFPFVRARAGLQARGWKPYRDARSRKRSLPVLGGQSRKARPAAHRVFQHGGLLVVHQDFFRHATEVLQAQDQTLIGVLSILPISAPTCPERTVQESESAGSRPADSR